MPTATVKAPVCPSWCVLNHYADPAPFGSRPDIGTWEHLSAPAIVAFREVEGEARISCSTLQDTDGSMLDNLVKLRLLGVPVPDAGAFGYHQVVEVDMTMTERDRLVQQLLALTFD